MLPKQILTATKAPSVRQFSITFANVWQQIRSKTAGQSTVVFRENILLPRFPLFVNGSRLKRNLNDPQSHEYTRGQKLRRAYLGIKVSLYKVAWTQPWDFYISVTSPGDIQTKSSDDVITRVMKTNSSNHLQTLAYC